MEIGKGRIQAKRAEVGKGLAIGGMVLSTLIVVGIFFLAMLFSMLADA